MNTQNLKPFNLERALAGDPVVTRNGRTVTDLTLFNANGFCIAGVVDTYLHKWGGNGGYLIGAHHDYDLFMAPIEKSGWISIVTPKNCSASRTVGYCSNIYATEALAKEYGGGDITIPISWTE